MALSVGLATAAVRGDRAAFIGGTVTTVPRGTQGDLNVDGTQELTFSAKEGGIRIPYAQITEMEFGQKVGRRVGATIALGVTTLGIGALPVLFSKKKKHYLTVSYQSGTSGEVAVFEMAKDIVKTVLPTLEARTGKKVLHEGSPGEDDYARAKSKKVEVVQTAPLKAEPAQATPVTSVTNQVADRPSQPARLTPMNNQDVLRMAASGVSQDLILTTIRNSEPHFSLAPAFMDQLSKSGVSDDVIKAMAARQGGR
jgi:hypothetical protein